MKAGTAQKLILNMLTTSSMVKVGKVYKNYMIDVKPTNIKLKNRAVKIVAKIAEVSENIAQKTLAENDFKIKPVILNLKHGLEIAEAERLLAENNGVLRKVFEQIEKEK